MANRFRIFTLVISGAALAGTALSGMEVNAASPPEPARPVARAPLTARHIHDLRCAAAFAIVAVGQARADPATRSLPPVGIRGRRYLGQVGERVAAEAGLTRAAVQDLLAQEARTLGQRDAPGVARDCLGDLDTAVPAHPVPAATECAAILGAYADVLAARDPASPLAADLYAQATALAGSARDAAGKHQLDMAKARARDALDHGAGSIDADDFAACRLLAQHG